MNTSISLEKLTKQNDKKNLLMSILSILFIVILIYIVSVKMGSEKFEPPLSSQMNQIYKNYMPNCTSQLNKGNIIDCESCVNTVNIMKNYNNNNTAIQILQDSNNFQDSLKCYKKVAENLKLPPGDCYKQCMNGNFGLPSADVLCNSACSQDNCIDSYFSNVVILKK